MISNEASIPVYATTVKTLLITSTVATSKSTEINAASSFKVTAISSSAAVPIPTTDGNDKTTTSQPTIEETETGTHVVTFTELLDILYISDGQSGVFNMLSVRRFPF